MTIASPTTAATNELELSDDTLSQGVAVLRELDRNFGCIARDRSKEMPRACTAETLLKNHQSFDKLQRWFARAGASTRQQRREALIACLEVM